MFESESAFVDHFVSSATPTLWSRRYCGVARTAYESDCSDGRADWVWSQSVGIWPKSWCERTGEILQNPTCSRILAELKQSSPRTKQFLQQRVGVSFTMFKRSVRDLLEVSLIQKTKDELLLLSPKAKFPDIEICAFEFKLEDWKRAFYQATRYRSFAHRVYVVLPEPVMHRTEKAWPAFQQQNIGLIAFDETTGGRRILLSCKRPPRSKSRYYQALGMLHLAG